MEGKLLVTIGELVRQTPKAEWEGTERRWPLEAKVQQVGQQESPRQSEQDSQALRHPMLGQAALHQGSHTNSQSERLYSPQT